MRLRDRLAHPMPIYVTRQNADGEAGTLSMSIGVTLLSMMLVWLNVIAWSIIGLITAVQVVV